MVATTPLTYDGYVTQIGVMAVVQTQPDPITGVIVGVDAAFNAIIPQMLNYAELRIQRDLDLLPSVISNNAYSLTYGSNLVSVSVNDFVTIQTVSLILPNGLQTQMTPVTKEFILNVWGNSNTPAIPKYFAMYGGDTATGGDLTNYILVGPYPNQTYGLNITGTQRLPTLYQFSAAEPAASTGTTFISTYLPDLLIMASMVYISAYQRNFGRQSDDPAMAVSYESQYQTLLKGAMVEEYRKKFEASAWSSRSPAVVATPTR